MRISPSLRTLGPDEQSGSRVEYLDLVHPDDRSRVEAEHQLAESQPGWYYSEHRLRSASGQVLRVAETIVSQADELGVVRRLTGVVVDLTPRRADAASGERMPAPYLAAIATGRDGGWEVDSVTGGARVSPRFRELLGRSGAEPPASLDEWLADFEPEDARSFLRAIEDCRVGRAKGLTLELRAPGRDGVRRYFFVRGGLSEGGRVAGLFTEVTQSQSARESLQEANGILRAVSDAAFESFLVLRADRDVRGEVVDFVFEDVGTKTERAIGLPRERLVGKRLTELAPASRTDGSLDRFVEAMRKGEPVEDDVVLAQGGLYASHLRRRVFPLADGVAVATSDVTPLGRAERALADSERFVQRITEAIPDALFVWDLTTDRHVYRNRDFFAELGYTPADRDALGDRPFPTLVHPEDRRLLDEFRARIERLSDEEVADVVFRMRAAGGDSRWISLRASIFTRDSAGRPTQVLETAQDVTSQRSYERKLEEQMERLEAAQTLLETRQKELEQLNSRLGTLASTDSLTGLKNYRAFQERLVEEIERAKRYGHPLALVLADVDHFKAFNDEYGHPAGDEVLRTFGKVLQSASRTSDLVVRYGGEEFALVLPNTTAREAAVLAERIRESLRRIPVEGRTVTASFGCAELRSGSDGKTQLVADADRALYRSKNEGRDRVSIAD